MRTFLVGMLFLRVCLAQDGALTQDDASTVDAGGVNCTFKADPDRFTAAQARAERDVYERTLKFSRAMAAGASRNTIAAGEIPRRNFIDEAIFGRLQQANVPSARVSSDEEFARRIYLDLTGRIPTPQQAREFLADENPGKRNDLIGRLAYSPEFTDRWTLWLADLVQNAAFNAFQNLQIRGRNAFHGWLKTSVAANKSLKDIAYEALVAQGNTFSDDQAGANYIVRSRAAGGPIQDIYDSLMARSAQQWLGMAHYDCVLCHDGRGHLDQISLWGRGAKRESAQKMAAFFARTTLTFKTQNQQDPLYNSWDVGERATGTYDLNTVFGNRPNRTPYGAVRNLTPEYRDGTAGGTSDWRGAYAANLVKDPMFAKNLANRLWKQLFNLGLVDPEDTLDPARLDSTSPPPEGWVFQASHPALLDRLAQELTDMNFDLREFVRKLAESSAYQLSSKYDATWKLDYVPLYARHYPRRLEGEEVHDAIQTATGVNARYTVQFWGDPVTWAMQLPEPVEPRSNGASLTFMNAFLRGNRDTQERQQAGSILQQLNLMNDAFVLTRIKVAASPVMLAASKLNNEEAVDELFMIYLTRRPSAEEKSKAVAYIAKAAPNQRNNMIDDVAWALVNRLEFIFSY